MKELNSDHKQGRVRKAAERGKQVKANQAWRSAVTVVTLVANQSNGLFQVCLRHKHKPESSALFFYASFTIILILHNICITQHIPR